MRTAYFASRCLLLAAAVIAAGCERKPQPYNSAGAAAGDSGAAAGAASSASPANDAAVAADFLRGTAQPQTGGLPHGHPPIDGMEPTQPGLPPGHPPVPSMSGLPTPSGGELNVDAPSSWTPRPPSSSMRRAQWAIPKAEGDDEDGEMILFFFGAGEGGGVADNLARWRGMFMTADGAPVAEDAATQDSFEVNGFKVTYLEVAGHYEQRMAPGAPLLGTKSNQRMLAAVIEGEGGPWFLRGVGPDSTMAANREAFLEMLKTVQR